MVIIDWEQLRELKAWMVDNEVLEVEIEGMKLKLHESALPIYKELLQDDDNNNEEKGMSTDDDLSGLSPHDRIRYLASKRNSDKKVGQE